MRRWVCLALIVGGCQYDRPADLGRDVGGSITGLWDGAVATIDLVIDGDSQSVTLDGDGAFVFPGDVGDGTAYEIHVASALHTCDVTRGTGVVDGADITDIRVVCRGPQVEVELSAPISWTFQPEVLDQELLLSDLATALSFRATSPVLTSVSLDATSVAPAAWSTPRTLVPGRQTWVLVLQAGAISRSYNLTIDRGAIPIEQTIYAKASNSVAGDEFGIYMAIDGERLVVGAPYHDEPNSSGAAYVLRRQHLTWVEEAFVRPLKPVSNEHLGPVAVSDDLLVAGVPGGILAGAAGRAYVFRRTAGGWQQEVVLTGANTEAGDRFGVSVGLTTGS